MIDIIIMRKLGRVIGTADGASLDHSGYSEGEI
jgi:hypothetical protein